MNLIRSGSPFACSLCGSGYGTTAQRNSRRANLAQRFGYQHGAFHVIISSTQFPTTHGRRSLVLILCSVYRKGEGVVVISRPCGESMVKILEVVTSPAQRAPSELKMDCA